MTFLASFWDFALFTDIRVFLIMMVAIMTVIGAMSTHASIALMSGYMTFVYAAMDSSIPLFENTLYIIVVLLSIFMGLKLWGYSTEGGAT